ncbi:MAG: BamA/TamA family outer membrane protein [Rhizobacter sp.]|nr:BamA/TamA family outer membrane protein [Chlorobiales bacterium]
MNRCYGVAPWQRCLFYALIVFFCAPPLQAQDTTGNRPRPATPDVPQNSSLKIFIQSLSVSGNKAVPTDEIKGEMITKENTTYFGFFRPWLGLYNFANIFGDSSGVKLWIQRTLGEAPRYYTRTLLGKDTDKLRELFFYYGYPSAQIDTSLRFASNLSGVDIKINITENEPLRIDSIFYLGIDSLSADVRGALNEKSLMQQGDVFNYKSVLDEQQRIVALLQDVGYPFAVRDSVSVDTLNNKAGVRFLFQPKEQLVFGNIRVLVHNPFGPDSTAELRTQSEDSITIDILGEKWLHPNAIRRALAYKPGILTSNRDLNNTRRLLGRTELFESSLFRNDSVKDGRLYTTLDLRLAPQHQIRFDLLLSNPNNAPNIGISPTYTNRNLMGLAENFRVKASAGIQLAYPAVTNTDQTLNRSLFSNLELSAEVRTPFFFNANNRFSASTIFGIYEQPSYRLRNATLRLRAELEHTALQKSVFDMFQLEIVQIDTSASFNPAELPRGSNFDLGYQPHINASIRYDFFFSNLPEERRRIDLRWDFSAEEAGASTYLIDQLLDNSPRENFTSNDAQIFGIRYFQFLKLRTQLVIGKSLSRNSYTAAKLYLGAMTPYAKSQLTPFERRFFSGGANSLRGWPYNSFGPGARRTPDGSGVADVNLATLGADLKIEFGFEHRITFAQAGSFSLGFALFTDAGNIWDRTGVNALTLGNLFSTSGWDAGYGFRVQTPIGPLRFDLAYKLYDPTEPVDKFRFGKLQIFGAGGAVFNFGIGEAF